MDDGDEDRYQAFLADFLHPGVRLPNLPQSCAKLTDTPPLLPWPSLPSQAPGGGGGGAEDSDSDVDYETVNPAARAVAARALRGGPPPGAHGLTHQAGGQPASAYPPPGGMPSRALPPRAARTAAAASGWPSLGWMDGPASGAPRAGQENQHPVGGGAGAGAATAAAAPCAPGVPELTAAHVNAAADAAAAVVQTVMAQQRAATQARGGAALLPPDELARLVASAMLTETVRLGMLGNALPPLQQQQQPQQPQNAHRRKAKAAVPVFGTSQHAALPPPEVAAQFAVRAVQDLAGLGALSGRSLPGAGGAVGGGVQSVPPPAQALVGANRASNAASAGAAARPHVPAVFTANFTALQLRCVRKQLHEHTQLLLQVLTLSARAPGPAMATAASTTYGLLAGLVSARAAALETGAAERYPVAVLACAAPKGPLYNGPGGSSWASVVDESLVLGDDSVYGSEVEAWWPGSPTTGLATLLDIPPLKHIPEFLAAVDKLPPAAGGGGHHRGADGPPGWSSEPHMMGGDDDDAEADPDAVPRTAARRHRAQPPSVAVLPVAHPVLRDLLALRFGHSRLSSPALVVHASSWPRDQFTPGEDRLLATGFHTFGRNWAAVAQHLLPSRSTLQLSNRWKNATGAARNAKAVKGRSGAPLRAAAAAVTAPLTVSEAQALKAARVALMGQKSALTVTGSPLVWSQLAAHCWRLGHVQRPASVLQKLWRELLAASGCTSKPKGKAASAPDGETEHQAADADDPAAHQAAMMGPMDGDDAWRDADVDPDAEQLGGGGAQQHDAGDEPRGDAPAGAACLLSPGFMSGDAAAGSVTARELRGSPAAPMDRYELMDAFMLQHLPQQAPVAAPAAAPQPAAPVRAQPSGGPSGGGGWRELPPPLAPPPPVPPAGFRARGPPDSLALGGELPCHSTGGMTALLAEVGIHVAVTGAPSWAPPPMLPGRGRHGTASRKRDAAAAAGDDTQTVATGVGGGATSTRRRRVVPPAPSVTAHPPAAAAKKSQGGSGSGQAGRKKAQGREDVGGSTGKRKRASKPAASSAGGTNSGQHHKSVSRPRPGGRGGAAAAELPRFDDADFVFDPADIPPEERLLDDVVIKKRRQEAPPERSPGAAGGGRPTVEHRAAATLSAMCAPFPRGNSPPSTGKKQFQHEHLADSPAPKRVTFAEQEVLMDSGSDSEGEPPAPAPAPAPQPQPLPVSPPPVQLPPAQEVAVPVPVAEAPAVLRDNEVIHEGEVLQFTPAEDKAILIAARGAPQGKPTLMTFALLLCDSDHPLLVGGKSAAQAQTRYLDLVRRMTAARAAKR